MGDRVYHRSLCVQVQTRSKLIESSYNRVAVNLDSMFPTGILACS